MKRLLSGNEAVARAAWEAGVKVGSGYPGTPSTEILEAFAPYPGVYAEWAPNEKVGLDVAVGAAYAGRRACDYEARRVECCLGRLLRGGDDRY